MGGGGQPGGETEAGGEEAAGAAQAPGQGGDPGKAEGTWVGYAASPGLSSVPPQRSILLSSGLQALPGRRPGNIHFLNEWSEI